MIGLTINQKKKKDRSNYFHMDSLLIETIVHINQLEIIVNFEKHVHVDFLFFMQYYICF
jgi:hypothetical protein